MVLVVHGRGRSAGGEKCRVNMNAHHGRGTAGNSGRGSATEARRWTMNNRRRAKVRWHPWGWVPRRGTP